MILSQDNQPGTHSAPAKIACELNSDHQPVSHITVQGLDFYPR